jgi:hypothetical protein
VKLRSRAKGRMVLFNSLQMHFRENEGGRFAKKQAAADPVHYVASPALSKKQHKNAE